MLFINRGIGPWFRSTNFIFGGMLVTGIFGLDRVFETEPAAKSTFRDLDYTHSAAVSVFPLGHSCCFNCVLLLTDVWSVGLVGWVIIHFPFWFEYPLGHFKSESNDYTPNNIRVNTKM